MFLSAPGSTRDNRHRLGIECANVRPGQRCAGGSTAQAERIEPMSLPIVIGYFQRKLKIAVLAFAIYAALC